MNNLQDERSEILDQCLERIQSGENSISDCLQAYPEHAEFLRTHLFTALDLRAELSPKGPNQAYAETTKVRIMNQIQSRYPKTSTASSRRRLRLFPSSRFATTFVSLAIVFVLLLSGLGVTTASAQALPGDTLYGVKRGLEEIRLFLSTSVTGDADLLAQFTQERLEELEQLVANQRTMDIPQALEEYGTLLSRLLEVAEETEIQVDPDTLEKIHGGISHHEEVLRRVLENAPTSAHQGLENALERSNHGKTVIEYIQDGGNPSDLAPGQQKDKPGGKDKEEPEDKNDKPHPKGKTPGPKQKENPSNP